MLLLMPFSDLQPLLNVLTLVWIILHANKSSVMKSKPFGQLSQVWFFVIFPSCLMAPHYGMTSFCIPQPLILLTACLQVFDLLHGFSYLGVHTPQHLVCGQFIWFGMHRDIAEWSHTCHAWQFNKIHQHHHSEVIPLKSTSTEDCAQALLLHWVAGLGVPNHLTSDHEPQFTSTWWSSIVPSLVVSLNHRLAYHPEVNRVVNDFTKV